MSAGKSVKQSNKNSTTFTRLQFWARYFQTAFFMPILGTLKNCILDDDTIHKCRINLWCGYEYGHRLKSHPKYFGKRGTWLTMACGYILCVSPNKCVDVVQANTNRKMILLPEITMCSFLSPYKKKCAAFSCYSLDDMAEK